MHATFGSVAELLTSRSEAGRPMVAFAELCPARGVEAGVWSSTPGGWAIETRPDTEVVVISSGRACINNADGTGREVGEGDVFVLPRGWSGPWDDEETVEKLYVVVTDDREGTDES